MTEHKICYGAMGIFSHLFFVVHFACQRQVWSLFLCVAVCCMLISQSRPNEAADLSRQSPPFSN